MYTRCYAVEFGGDGECNGYERDHIFEWRGEAVAYKLLDITHSRDRLCRRFLKCVLIALVNETVTSTIG